MARNSTVFNARTKKNLRDFDFSEFSIQSSNKTWQAHKKSAAARTQQAKLTQKTNYFAKNWLTSSNKELGRLLAGWFPAVDYVEHARS